MLGVLSLIANSDADSRKGRMAVNMDGTCMQGLSLSSYQSSTLRYAVAQLQLLMQGSVGVRSYQREIMIEDARFECNYTSTSSITRFNKLCDARAQTLSIASAVLGQLPSLFTRWFARPHSLLFFRLHALSRKKCFKYSFGRPVWCAAENWFAVIQFYSMQQSLDSLLNLKDK
jgi:hypothetical protein